MQQALVLPCAKGSEQVLAAEAEALGLENVKIGVAVVRGVGDLNLAYRLCLWSRVASRVLWILDEQAVENPEAMYEMAKALPWEDHFEPDTTFAVSFNGMGQGIDNTQFGAFKIKDAIVDRLREKWGRRPNVDTQQPQIQVDAHLRKGHLTLALDLSGGALHQRGYRQAQGAAPLKEQLAATILYRNDWAQFARECEALIDPLCGSGTLLLEALLMAADIAPALTRPRFGFEYWAAHKPSVWKRLREEALARREDGLNALDLKVWGFDANPQVLRAARENAQRLDLGHVIHFESRPLSAFQHQKAYGERGLILSNPPYGERLGSLVELLPLYEQLGQSFKSFPAAWRMSMIANQPDLIQRMKLRSSKRYQAFNGALAADILLYERAAQPEAQQEPSQTAVDEQARMFANRLRKNWTKAQKEALQLRTEAFRVYDQDMPEYAVAIDVYGDWALVQEYAPPPTVAPEKAKKRLLDVLRLTPEILGIAPAQLVLKTRERQSGKNQYQKQGQSGQYLSVREGEALFRVNLHDYLDTGLFLDHRAMRRRLHQEAAGKRFLNLFCYTASASVQAALGGAAYTTSVDLSQNYLDWAHQNFDENQLDNRHRLIKADVMAWLNEGDSQFDLIFCDPPTFSNTKKEQRVFDVQRDHVRLIEACMKRLSASGVLYFSNNFRRFRLDEALKALYRIEPVEALDFDFARRPNIHHVWKIQHLN